jgi:phospholipid transport system transporter-binding protein
MQTLQLPAAASRHQAAGLLPQLDAAVAAARGDVLRIDGSALTEFDSATLALLLHAQRGAQAAGATLQLHGVPTKLRELARLYGVEPLLPAEGAGA